MRVELQQLVQSFNEQLELNIPTGIAEEEILLKLEERLGQLLQRSPEEFFRILYVVDIPEYQLNNALQQPDALTVLAKMVYNRQLGKVKSRAGSSTYFNKNDADADLAW